MPRSFEKLGDGVPFAGGQGIVCSAGQGDAKTVAAINDLAIGDIDRDFELGIGLDRCGESAISIAAALKPDVVVMDVNMPRIDGIEATRRIVSAQPDIVVIGLSVQNEHHVEEAMTRAGAAVFVTKERAAGQLYEAIVRTVRTRK